MNWKNIKNTVKFLLKLAVTILALYYVFSKIDVESLKDIIKQANWPLLLFALVLFFLSKIVESVRLNVFFKAKNLLLSQLLNFKLYLVGIFYNLFFPGGIGGDSYKVYWLNKNYSISIKPLIGAIIINRLNGVLALLSILLISALFISLDIQYAVLLLFGIPIMIAVYYFALRRYFNDLKSTVLSTTVLSFVLQMLQLISAHFILMALGVVDNFPDYWFIYMVSGFAFIIPVTVGGVGSRELVFLYGAQFLLIDLNIAIALSLLIYCMRMIVSILGAYYVLVPSKLKD